ncbi:MAG: hypothetical protein ACSLE6_14345 [Mycobacterium sp.]
MGIPIALTPSPETSLIGEIVGRHSATERVAPRLVRHGDVIQDPDSAQWLTVTRVIHDEVRVAEQRGYYRQEGSAPLWTFRGDDRLQEEITFHSDDAVVTRRVAD